MEKRKFAVFDIDGTLFRSGLYREIAHKMLESGFIDRKFVAEADSKLASWKRRENRSSYDNYEAALVEALDNSLTKIPTEIYDRAIDEIVAEQLDNVYTYTRARLGELAANGYFSIAISGSQLELVEPFAKKYNFDAWIGQRYLRSEDGAKFTGEIIKTYNGKDVLLQQIVEQNDLTYDGSCAYGDSMGDRGLLESVENPVAFNPTDDLLELAQRKGWPIVVERKSVVYEMNRAQDGEYKLTHAAKI